MLLLWVLTYLLLTLRSSAVFCSGVHSSRGLRTDTGNGRRSHRTRHWSHELRTEPRCADPSREQRRPVSWEQHDESRRTAGDQNWLGARDAQTSDGNERGSTRAVKTKKGPRAGGLQCRRQNPTPRIPGRCNLDGKKNCWGPPKQAGPIKTRAGDFDKKKKSFSALDNRRGHWSQNPNLRLGANHELVARPGRGPPNENSENGQCIGQG
jgi:hypothetical protein